MKNILTRIFAVLTLVVCFGNGAYAQTDTVTGTSNAAVQPQITPVGVCNLTGSTSVTQGTEVSYTLSCSGGTGAASWSVTCGSVASYTSTTANILWSGGCTTATLKALNASGIALGTLTVTVNPAPLSAGVILSNLTQTINYNTAPSLLQANTSTGGTCAPNYSYQWQSSTDGSTYANISGATSLSYQPGALTQTTYYRLQTTCGSASVLSAVTTVTVYPQLRSGTISPASQAINYGVTPSAITATAAVGGTGTYTYQWYSSTNGSSWAAVSSATGLSYTPPATTGTNYYELISTSNGVSVTSASATVTIYPQVVSGTISPGSQTINYNTTPAAMTVTAATGGNSSYSYQWYSSPNGTSWSQVPGATGLSYTPGALTSTTHYEVVATSNGATATSNAVTITVYPQLVSGTVSPTPQSINYNTTPTALTTTAATGGNNSYTYQWNSSSNGTSWAAISGATGTTYAPASLTATTYYQVVAASNGVSVTSATATVSVYPQLVTGTISPATQAINYNTTPTALSVTVPSGGNGSYTYQWYSSSNGTSWSLLPGATAQSYAPGALTATTYYHVVTTSNGVPVTSATATVTVYPALVACTISPTPQTINYNTAPTGLTATATSGGNGTYSYQWYSSTNGTSWAAISGATALSYPPGALTTTTYYEIIATSNGASISSAPATITVYPQLAGGTISPTAQNLNYNTVPTAFTTTAASGGNGSYSYQWYSSPNGSTWSAISSATGTSYAPGALTATTYYRLVTSSNGVSVTSATATATVYPQLVSGSVSPLSQNINYNTVPTPLTATAATGGNGSYTYQWYSSTNGTSWSAISTATGASYAPGALTTTTYYEIVSTSNGVSVASAPVTVSTYPQLVSGTISPASQNINYNTTPTAITSTAAAGGTGTYTYQWYSSLNGSTWSAISAATGTSYAPGALTVTTYYHLVATSNGVSVTSGTATVTVYPQLVAGVITPSSQHINYNTTPAPLTATAPTGGNGSYTYQWYSAVDNVNWHAISGATAISYAPGPLTATIYYRIIYTSNGVSVNTLSDTVLVYPQLITGVISPSSQTVNYGAEPTLSFSGTTGGTGTYTYQWESSSTVGGTYAPITGATSGSYIPPAGLTAATYYEVVQTSNGVSVTSAAATVSVYPQLITGTITPSSQAINYGAQPTLSVSGTTGGTGSYTYQWESSSTVSGTYTSISGATSSSYTPASGLTTATYYEAVQTSNGVSVSSAAAIVSVYPNLTAVIGVTQTSIPYGSDPGSITGTPSGGNGSYTYQWMSSTDGISWSSISGATGSTYEPGTLYSGTYYELIVTSNGASATSNILLISVASSGNLPGSDAPPSGTAAGISMPAFSSTLTDDSLNFIRVRVIKKPGVTDTVTADGLTSAYDAHQSTTYFDGLGRPIEEVDKQNTPTQQDLITPTFYDPFDRVAQKYLPYSDSKNTGTFRTDAATQQTVFYNGYYNNSENYYYGNTIYEASPLNRALSVTPPGINWTGSNRGVNTGYPVNTAAEDVRIWQITYGETDWPTSNSTYAAGTLYVTQTTDENGHIVREYKDLDGQVVLRKVQESLNPSIGHDGWLCTYYVFDDLNNLRCVIPPKAVAAISNSGWTLISVENLCFQYAYDYRNRIILKKVPDAQARYIIYNLEDLPVLTQDGNLRNLNEWQVTKYDGLEREIETGIYNASTSYTLDVMQQNVNNDQNYPESFTVNSQDYYDDYLQVSVPTYSGSDVSKLLTPANSYPDPVTQVNQTRGLVTTSMVRMLEFPTTLWLTTVNYYDEKGRVIQTNRVNSLTGGFDTTTMMYDFTGKLLSSYERYNNPLSVVTPRTTILSSTQYDHMGRVVQTTRQVNDNGINKVVSKKAYDALGRLSQDTLGNNIESLNYNYNIRGWLRGINQGYITGGSSHYFGMELNYDYGFGTPQYNGNIAGIKWKTVGSGIARAYGYLYDNVNRLIAAPFYQNDAGDGTTFVQDGKIDFSVPQISYDPNGNILTMNQKGLEVTSSAPIDQLTYAYNSSSNQLQSVTDAAPVDTSYHLGDFQDGNTSGNDYFYDANGNLGKDLNKKIDSIRYNYLNLPEYVHINGKGNINYAYDASGAKFLKIVTDSTKGGKMDTTIYMDAAVYHNDTLQFVNDEEGRIRYMNKVSQVSGVTLTGMVYDYFLKDHLGDTRMVLTEEQDTTIYVATMEPKNAAIEDQLFNNISTTQAPVPNGYEPSSAPDTSNHYVSKLWGATGGNRVGPSIVLKVMANDMISANVWGWYQGAVQPPPSQEVPLINDLLTTLSSDVVGQGGSELSGAVSPVTSALSLAMGSFITTNENPSYVTTAPKAFLNWVLFDDQLNYVTGSATQIPVITAGESRQPIAGNLPATIPKNGYLYIYVSNESQDTVFFDNLNINYRRGPVSEEEHYYPFGLTMSGISDRALQFGKVNKYRFQKQEFQFDEFSDHSGLDMYEFKYRFDDPQIGRFWSVDPLADEYEYNSTYAFSADKVTGDVELEGLEPVPISAIPPILDAAGAAFGASQSISGSSQELPTLNGLVNDINSLQLGYRIQGVINDDKGYAQAIGNAAVSAYNSVVNLFTGNNTSPAQVNATPAQPNAQTTTNTNTPASTQSNSKTKSQPGSYTNTHQSGKVYHGKGSKARSQKSGKEKADKYNDPHIATDWSPSPTSQQALKDENARIQNDNGIQNPNNYNIINSPGKNIP